MTGSLRLIFTGVLSLVVSLYALTAHSQEYSCVSAEATSFVVYQGNLNSAAPVISVGDIPEVCDAGDAPCAGPAFTDLNSVAAFSYQDSISDTLGAWHDVYYFFFHTGSSQYQVRGYVNSEDVDPSGADVGLPRLILIDDLTFNPDGSRSNPPADGTYDSEVQIPWNNGASNTEVLGVIFSPLTSLPTTSSIEIRDGDYGGGAVSFSGMPPTGTSEGDSAIQIYISANLDAGAAMIMASDIPGAPAAGNYVMWDNTSFAELNAVAEFHIPIYLTDESSNQRALHVFFFHTDYGEYTARVYAFSQDVDPGTPESGYPRLVGTATLVFDEYGLRTNAPSPPESFDIVASIPWNDGSPASLMKLAVSPVTGYSGTSLTCYTQVLYESSCGTGAPGADGDNDGVFDCRDACPDDSAKTAAGVCGCGVADSDLNENGALDCLDPDEATTPSSPRLSGNRRRVRVEMQGFPGEVHYLIEARSGRKSTSLKTAESSASLRNLSKGVWKLRYRLRVGEGQSRVFSRFSRWRKIKIN